MEGREICWPAKKTVFAPKIMATSINQRNFIQRRKENGLCLSCGNLLDREGIYCAKCRKKKTEENTDRRHWYQDNGICPRCGKNDLTGDERICPECNAKAYEVTMRSRERLGREHYNKQHAKWAKIEHQKRIEKGICTRCGKRKADGGYKTCGICRAADKERKRTKKWKPNRSERIERGLCYFCDNPIKEGYKVCEKHYEMNICKLGNEKCRKATEDMKKKMNIYFVKK